MNIKKIKHIYTLDNGNGNVMAYCLDPHAEKPTAQPITNEFGEPAGFVRNPKGEILLGKQLTSNDYETFSLCGDINTNFKAIPTSENREIMVEYLRGWLRRLERNCPSIVADGEDAVWLIGCPTGWKSTQAREDYRKIFEEAGFQNPIIVFESNAAMAHFEKISHAVEAATEAGGAMCADFGAYSNDITFISPGKVQSIGSYVGASLIEKMIIMANLKDAARYITVKTFRNSDEQMEAVYQRFQTDPKFRSFMLLQGRWLKEQYYTKKKDNTLNPKGVLWQVFLEDFEVFNLSVNTAMMNDIIEGRPIREMLGEDLFSELSEETQAEVGSNTWKECLVNFLNRAVNEFPEFGKNAFGTEKKAVVMVTGGASEMDFIENTVQDVYPNIQLEMDTTPLLSIALGLADFAPDKLKAMLFDQAFQEILDETELDEDGDERSMVLSKLIDAYWASISNLIPMICNFETSDLLEAVKNWLECNIRSEEIETDAKSRFNRHFQSDVLPAVDKGNQECDETVTAFINGRFEQLLRDSGIASTKLFAGGELKLEFAEFFRDTLMAGVKRSIENDYKYLQENVFVHFPNPGKFNILSSRADYFNGVSDALIKILKELSDETEKYLFDLFVTRKLVEDDDDSKVILLFCYNVLANVNEKLQEKKRTLLGDLIVEEN